MEQLVLRPAHKSEARQIASLSRLQIEHGLNWRWTPQRVRQQIADPETMVLVASRSGEICGFAIMRFGDDNAHLMLLAVDTGYRRQGIGRALIDWLEKSVGTAGLRGIRVEVRSNNQGAQRFYASLGYQAHKHLPRYYDGKESAIVLIKSLAVGTN